MTKNEFEALGNGYHRHVTVEWNGRQWRLSKTFQATETCMLQPLGKRIRFPVATGYRYVKLIKKEGQ